MKIEITCDDERLMPRYADEDAAGLDMFYGGPTVTLIPGEVRILGSGVKMAIAPGWWGKLFDRSGKGSQGLLCLGGVIDSNYRGEVGVIMGNVGTLARTVNYGDKITQMCFFPKVAAEISVVKSLSVTARGESGFGSTGK